MNRAIPLPKNEIREELPEVSRQVHHARYFSFPSQRAVESPVAVVYGGLEICNTSYRIERDEFPFYTVELVVSGTGEVTLAEGKRMLCGGAVYLYGPELPCRIVNHPQSPLRKYFISFSSMVPDLLSYFELRHTQFAQSHPDDGLLSLADLLFSEGCSSQPCSFEICNQTLTLMLMRFARSANLATQREEPGWAVFCRCRSVLDARFLELRTLKELSEMLDLSASYISRLFKRYHHTSPYQYLQGRKLSYAESLLRHEGATVEQAAQRAGFEDPFHFSRAFKKFKGFSPGHFRRHKGTS